MASTSLLRPDRFTSLPDDLLTRILSTLPIKEAAVAQVLSKKMPRAFCCITSVDSDDSLRSHCGFYHAAKLKDPLPMFHNLKTLRLGSLCDYCCSARWDIVLLLIIHRSPLLEELVFIEGFFDWDDDDDTCSLHVPDSSDAAALEANIWGLTQTTPLCCEFHLKRIRIYKWRGSDQELNMMRFLLGKASVLKELVISMAKEPGEIVIDTPKLIQFMKALKEIPRASNSCSIIYSGDEPDYDDNKRT